MLPLVVKKRTKHTSFLASTSFVAVNLNAILDRGGACISHPSSRLSCYVCDALSLLPNSFAADGNAANTGATSGNVWVVHFAPDEIGIWTWTASFTKGPNVAQNGGGKPVKSFIDGKSGIFEVLYSDKTGRDLRGKGRLEYVGEHFYQFAGNKEWFLKAGADSPENFLAYDDFDGTPDIKGRRKSWAPHAKDYVAGQPTWMNGKGTEMIGGEWQR